MTNNVLCAFATEKPPNAMRSGVFGAADGSRMGWLSFHTLSQKTTSHWKYRIFVPLAFYNSSQKTIGFHQNNGQITDKKRSVQTAIG